MFPEAVNGGLAYDPVHQRMYVTNYNSANMLVIDTMSNTVSSITIEKYAAYIAYDPVHQRVYVPIFGNPNGNNIDDVVVGKKILVVDTISNTIQNTIEIDYGPFDIVYDSKNRKMYVSMVGSRFDNQFNPLNLSVLNRINVINTDNNEIEKEIIVSKGPSALAYDPIYQRIYVTIFGSEDPNGGNNKIDVICS